MVNQYRPQGLSLYEAIDWVLEHNTVRTETGCLSYPLVLDKYPKIEFQGKKYKLNRIVLARKLGREIREGYQACHTCDNPICCEADHLFEGTNLDNIVDCVNKGRKPKGEQHWKCKLTTEEVQEIRSLKGVMRQIDIAVKFKITQSQVSQITNFKQRKEVNSWSP